MKDQLWNEGILEGWGGFKRGVKEGIKGLREMRDGKNCLRGVWENTEGN